MQNTLPLKSLNILGVHLNIFESYQHIGDLIVERITNNQKTFCVAINPEKIYRSQKDQEFKQLLNSGDFHICDGVGAALAARILYHKKVHRITGIQLFLNLMSRAEKVGLKVFLFGAKPDSNKKAFKKLLEMHPDLQIVGRQDGYSKDQSKVIQTINDSHADMLFVALGTPNQENWIIKYHSQINVPFCMGIGGTLDIVSGNVKWAPKIFRKTGTEFLYRLIKEPSRWKRQRFLLNFALLVLKSRFMTRNSQMHSQLYKYENLE